MKKAYVTKILSLAKKNIVMLIALLAATVTIFFVPIDKQYLEYFDYKTLTCLFCTLAIVCALKNIHFFYMLAHKIVQLFKNARMSVLAPNPIIRQPVHKPFLSGNHEFTVDIITL